MAITHTTEERKREGKRRIFGEEAVETKRAKTMSVELCLGLFTLLCQEKGAVSSWKSRSLFCHTGLLCLHSSLKDREGPKNTIWFKPQTAAYLHIKLMQNDYFINVCCSLNTTWYRFSRPQFLLYVCFTAFCPQMVFLCFFALSKLLCRRTVRSRVVRGLPQLTFSSPLTVLKPCVD